MTIVLLALLLQNADKTEKQPPAKIIAEAVKTLRKQSQFSHESDYKGRRFEGKISGIVRKDAHYPVDAPEIYAKGSQSLVKDRNGRYVPSPQVDPQSNEGKALAAFRNPDTMLAEIESAGQKIAPERRADEKAADKDCALLVVSLPTEMKKTVLKSMSGSFTGPIPLPNPDQFIDYEKTLCRYLVWVSKTDLSIVQFRFDLEIAGKKGGLPMGLPGGFDPASWTCEILLHVALDDAQPKPVPKEVQNKLGLK